MSDQKLLELAAKTAGMGPVLCYESARNCLRIGIRSKYRLWRPLTDEGDALSLASYLEIPTGFHDGFGVLGKCAYATYPTGPDSCNSIMQGVAECGSKESALMLAIVRAAAEIGKSMP